MDEGQQVGVLSRFIEKAEAQFHRQCKNRGLPAESIEQYNQEELHYSFFMRGARGTLLYRDSIPKELPKQPGEHDKPNPGKTHTGGEEIRRYSVGGNLLKRMRQLHRDADKVEETKEVLLGSLGNMSDGGYKITQKELDALTKEAGDGLLGIVNNSGEADKVTIGRGKKAKTYDITFENDEVKLNEGILQKLKNKHADEGHHKKHHDDKAEVHVREALLGFLTNSSDGQHEITQKELATLLQTGGGLLNVKQTPGEFDQVTINTTAYNVTFAKDVGAQK